MNDQRKTKKQLLEDLQLERERSLALQQVSKRVAAAHDTDEVLDLIVNEAARLVGVDACFIRLLEGDQLTASVATEAAVEYVTELQPNRTVGEGMSFMGHVLATKRPRTAEEVQDDDLISPEAKKNQKKHGFHETLAIPLLANDLALGVLVLFDTRIRRFTEEEISLLTAFADQTALALEKARLLNEAEREKERSDALYRVSNLVAGAHDTDEVLDLIVNEAARLVGTHGAYIRLLEGGTLVANVATASVAEYVADASSLFPGFKVEEGTSAFGHTMAPQKPVVIEDTQNSEWVKDAMRANLMKHGIDSCALIPLLANDVSLGVLVVLDIRVRRFTEDEVSLLAAFADQAALALEKARLLNEAARLLKAPAAFLRLLEGGVLIPGAATESARRYLEDAVDEEPTLAVGESGGLVGHVMANQKPVVFEDISESELLSKVGHIRTARHGIHGFMAVPLMANDRALGVLALMDTRIRLFTDDEVSLLSAFADQAALALEKARLLKEAETERERANSLYRISNLLAGAHDTDEVLNLIVNEAGRLLVAPSVKIRLLDGDTLGIPREHWKPREI